MTDANIALKPCPMGVGCDEAGVCYAEANGEPERCPRTSPTPPDDVVERLRELADFSRAAKGDHLRGVHPNVAARAFDTAIAALTAVTQQADRDAVQPFIDFANHAVDDEGWVSGIGRERICDWFGPSEFRALKVKSSPAPQAGMDARHAYEPDDKYPWFCGLCGYGEGELLKHLPATLPINSMSGDVG